MHDAPELAQVLQAEIRSMARSVPDWSWLSAKIQPTLPPSRGTGALNAPELAFIWFFGALVRLVN